VLQKGVRQNNIAMEIRSHEGRGGPFGCRCIFSVFAMYTSISEGSGLGELDALAACHDE